MATRKSSGRFALVAALAATLAIVAVGWTGAANSRAAARHLAAAATVQTKKVGKFGVILVNSKGRTLYMFKPDKQKKVTCKGSCAAAWPPLKVKKGQHPTAGGAAHRKLLGLDGRVVTYNRWPLYTYVGDSKPGQTNGQAQNLNGGLWYVMSPSGKFITKH